MWIRGIRDHFYLSVISEVRLPYQHIMLWYWHSLARTGVGGWGFDAGEEALDTAFTSKEGSRRVNYSILFWWGSDKKFWREGNFHLQVYLYWKHKDSKDWRASLVPAAAVTPASRMYINIVAIKSLVIYVLSSAASLYWVQPLTSWAFWLSKAALVLYTSISSRLPVLLRLNSCSSFDACNLFSMEWTPYDRHESVDFEGK